MYGRRFRGLTVGLLRCPVRLRRRWRRPVPAGGGVGILWSAAVGLLTVGVLARLLWTWRLLAGLFMAGRRLPVGRLLPRVALPATGRLAVGLLRPAVGRLRRWLLGLLGVWRWPLRWLVVRLLGTAVGIAGFAALLFASVRLLRRSVRLPAMRWLAGGLLWLLIGRGVPVVVRLVRRRVVHRKSHLVGLVRTGRRPRPIPSPRISLQLSGAPVRTGYVAESDGTVGAGHAQCPHRGPGGGTRRW
ncbi:hypothetical protein NOGI109294_19145 [Nocardiopsis gilva]